MPNLTFSIGQLKITPLFWSLLPALLFASFSFWRKLREDYKEEAIFGLNLLLLVSLGSLVILSSLFVKIKGISLPIVFLGAILILKAWSFKTKCNLWEILDALTLPFLYLLFFSGIGYFFSTGNLWDLKNVGSALFSFLVYLLSKNKYRSFSWYKSGKTGFLFWEASFVIFLIFSVLAFMDNDVLYFESVIFILLTIVSAGLVYHRAERNIKNDLKQLFLKK